MYRNETSSKNILGSSWGPLNTSLVMWRGKMIRKYSFYSLLSAFKNKHVFAITFHDSLRPVLKNGKKTAQKVFILYFKITRPLNRYCMFGNFTMILFYIFTTSLVFSLCSRSERFHQSPFLQLHLLFLLMETLETMASYTGYLLGHSPRNHIYIKNCIEKVPYINF